MTGTGPPERRELVRGAAAAARAWLGRALRRRDRATSRREAPFAPPGRRVRSSGGPSDAQPATVHGSRRRSERPARGRGARARPSRVLRCASRASRRRSAGASPLWAGLGGPWGVSSCSPHCPPRRPWQPGRSLRSLAAHQRSEAVGGVEPAVARALGRRVEAPGRSGWPMVRRAARRTARHAARGGQSGRWQPRRARAAVGDGRRHRAGRAAGARQARRPRALQAQQGSSARRQGRGITSARGAVARIDPTRLPGVLSGRGWARDPRGARQSALGRPGGPDRHFGRSLAARATSRSRVAPAHCRAPSSAPRATPGATEGGSETASAGATPWWVQSCHKSSSEFEPSRRPLLAALRPPRRAGHGRPGRARDPVAPAASQRSDRRRRPASARPPGACVAR